MLVYGLYMVCILLSHATLKGKQIIGLLFQLQAAQWVQMPYSSQMHYCNRMFLHVAIQLEKLSIVVLAMLILQLL